jgi:hypothetical protein
MEFVALAKKSWVRVQADMGLGAYVAYVPKVDLPDPEWPQISLRDLLKLAFRNAYIDSMDHPALRRLRGEV